MKHGYGGRMYFERMTKHLLCVQCNEDVNCTLRTHFQNTFSGHTFRTHFQDTLSGHTFRTHFKGTLSGHNFENTPLRMHFKGVWEIIIIIGVSNKNLEASSLQCKSGVYDENLGVSHENPGVSNKKLSVSYENLGVFNQNLGSSIKIWGFPIKILGSPMNRLRSSMRQTSLVGIP